MEALQAQMEEQTRLAKEQVESLLEDRRIKTEEAQAQQRRDQERITALNDKWVSIFSCSLLMDDLQLKHASFNTFHVGTIYNFHFLCYLTPQAPANPEPVVWEHQRFPTAEVWNTGSWEKLDGGEGPAAEGAGLLPQPSEEGWSCRYRAGPNMAAQQQHSSAPF